MCHLNELEVHTSSTVLLSILRALDLVRWLVNSGAVLANFIGLLASSFTTMWLGMCPTCSAPGCQWMPKNPHVLHILLSGMNGLSPISEWWSIVWYPNGYQTVPCYKSSAYAAGDMKTDPSTLPRGAVVAMFPSVSTLSWIGEWLSSTAKLIVPTAKVRQSNDRKNPCLSKQLLFGYHLGIVVALIPDFCFVFVFAKSS